MTAAEFMASDLRNIWTEDGPVKAYLRKGYHLVGGLGRATLDLANVEVAEAERRRGHLTRFLAQLDRLAAQHGFGYPYLENVHNQDLWKFLQGAGFQARPGFGSRNYTRKVDNTSYLEGTKHEG